MYLALAQQLRLERPHPLAQGHVRRQLRLARGRHVRRVQHPHVLAPVKDVAHLDRDVLRHSHLGEGRTKTTKKRTAV